MIRRQFVFLLSPQNQFFQTIDAVGIEFPLDDFLRSLSRSPVGELLTTEVAVLQRGHSQRQRKILLALWGRTGDSVSI